jgi:hypothetical protein
VRARVEVRDGSGRLLATAEVEDEVTTVLWLPLLPLNVLFAYDHHQGIGRHLGLNFTLLHEEEVEMFVQLVRNALLTAHERVPFRRPD